MKDKVEYELFLCALRRRASPGTVLSVVFVDLPDSNGALRFCIFRHLKYRQIVAGLQEIHAELGVHTQPSIAPGEIMLPERIVRYIRHQLKKEGVNHVLGIAVNDTTEDGTPLLVH